MSEVYTTSGNGYNMGLHLVVTDTRGGSEGMCFDFSSISSCSTHYHLDVSNLQ